MAHRVARPKNSRAIKTTAATVLTKATGWKKPKISATRLINPPTTAKGTAIMVRPDTVLVTKRHVRSTGRVCISPTARGEYR